MVEQYLVWVLLVGVAFGAAGAWFILGRLPRRSDDISPLELTAEADWISRTIAQRGGAAPPSLVEEVLELHLEYVAGEPLDVEPADVEPVRPTAPEGSGEARSRPPAPEKSRRRRRAR